MQALSTLPMSLLGKVLSWAAATRWGACQLTQPYNGTSFLCDSWTSCRQDPQERSSLSNGQLHRCTTGSNNRLERLDAASISILGVAHVSCCCWLLDLLVMHMQALDDDADWQKASSSHNAARKRRRKQARQAARAIAAPQVPQCT